MESTTCAIIYKAFLCRLLCIHHFGFRFDGVLMTFSAIFQLYREGLFYWWMKTRDPVQTTDLSQVIDKI
jgi:hypothetical protein